MKNRRNRRPTQVPFLTLPLAAVTLVFALSQVGCLKTRAQLRGDGYTDENATSAAAPAPANAHGDPNPPQYVVDELRAEITRLTGRIEDLERALRGNDPNGSPAVKPELIKGLESRIVELEKTQLRLLESLKISEEKAAATADPASLYEQGKSEFEEGKLEDAAETLAQYSAKSPKGKHLEEAVFLRAEALFGLKQYKKAILDYSKIQEKFPKSQRMPTVLYKIGQSFEKLGLHADAENFFQELQETFPKSPEAKKVKPAGKAATRSGSQGKKRP